MAGRRLATNASPAQLNRECLHLQNWASFGSTTTLSRKCASSRRNELTDLSAQSEIPLRRHYRALVCPELVKKGWLPGIFRLRSRTFRKCRRNTLRRVALARPKRRRLRSGGTRSLHALSICLKISIRRGCLRGGNAAAPAAVAIQVVAGTKG